MMLGSRWGPIVGALLLVAPFILSFRVLGASGDRTTSAETFHEAGVGAGAPHPAPVDSLARVVRDRGPFRPDGRPSARPYDPMRGEDQGTTYAPPMPVLALSGVLDGPAPAAILEGIPGREGSVILGVGDTAGGLRLRLIKEGRVTVTGMDTTWVLTLRRGP